MTRRVPNRMVWALGCVAALCLAACSGPAPSAEPTVGQTTGGSAAAAGTSAPPAAQASSPSADGSSAPTAAALCEYLTGQLPGLRAIGSEIGAMANLTGNLFGWYDEQGAVPVGTELDAMTQQECPEVGAEALQLAGVESFTAL